MILHITTRDEWEQAQTTGEYSVESLKNEGFIHCSTLQQVLGPANALYHGRHGLVLLLIDPDRVRARIVYEDCYQSGQAFPHIYGPLNADAVMQVVDFPPNDNGTFALPAEL